MRDGAARADEGGKHPWLSAQGEHLVVYTDLDAADVHDVVHALEDWRMALTVAILPGARPPSKSSR